MANLTETSERDLEYMWSYCPLSCAFIYYTLSYIHVVISNEQKYSKHK